MASNVVFRLYSCWLSVTPFSTPCKLLRSLLWGTGELLPAVGDPIIELHDLRSQTPAARFAHILKDMTEYATTSPADAADRLAIRELVDARMPIAPIVATRRGRWRYLQAIPTLWSTWIRSRRRHRKSFTGATLLLRSLTI